MWSYPSYDPNLIADPNYDAAFAALTELQEADGDPLLANAYQQRYMPGSTFKVITTGIALEPARHPRHAVRGTRASGCPPDHRPDRELRRHELRRRSRRGVRPQLQHPVRPHRRRARPRRVRRRAPATGASRSGSPSTSRAPRPAPSATSSDLADNLPLLAMRGFGQNEVQMVPMHMAMVAATVANDGNG
jgi:penicillin-binding protein A